MPDPITTFSGDHRFLSNFYPSLLTFRMSGRSYLAPTVEHAFQAAKVIASTLDDPDAREYLVMSILSMETPGRAKRRGGLIPLDVTRWDNARLDVMRTLLDLKFSDPVLGRMLLDTRDAPLVEGNTWGDRFWGVCDGTGENHLGRLLMAIRADLHTIHG